MAKDDVDAGDDDVEKTSKSSGAAVPKTKEERVYYGPRVKEGPL